MDKKRKKTKKIFLTDKKFTIILGGIIILVALSLIFGSIFFMDFANEKLWLIILAYVLCGILLIFGVLVVCSGIYIYPNGKVLCLVGYFKIKIFSLEQVNDIKIIFYEQRNGRYLAYISIAFYDGKKFIYSYVKEANEYPAHRNSSSAVIPIKKEQIEFILKQLADESKFSVEVKKLID
ncbi:MAG: hypothetical protein NC548_62485 [Lachnospiraceae bacterium]|nr:hypothetical protein [Lachnospiraceae bacterium]